MRSFENEYGVEQAITHTMLDKILLYGYQVTQC